MRENRIISLKVGITDPIFAVVYERLFISYISAELAVVFIDLCGFTAISENEEPNIVVVLLNEYFDLMVREIMNEEEIIDKFIGDAIMAVFKGDDYDARALRACIAIRNKINALPIYSEQSGFKPKVSIGINSGEMVSGNIGSISLKKLDFTVIGDTVNVASRLQSKASPGQILTLEKFANAAPDFKYNSIGKMELTNKALLVNVSEVE